MCSASPRAKLHRMLTRATSLILLCFVGVALADTDQGLQNVAARAGMTLNGMWHVIVDPYENGSYNYRREPFDAAPNPTGGYFLDRKPADKSELVEYDFDTSPTLRVPGDWNSQDDRLYYYEGAVWYRRKFDYAPPAPGRRVFVHFGAANYQADVYLNGRKLGRHVGGFTPFEFEITGKLAATDNSLVVKVDNARHADAVPTVNTDWWNYGGLTRDVTIVETPATFVRDYRLQLAPGSTDRIVGTVELDGARARVGVTLSIPEAGIRIETLSDSQGIATFDVSAPALELWAPQSPKLYAVELATGDDEISERIGFRSIAVRGADILLNGRSIFLRGNSLHEENPLRGGRAYSAEDARLLLGWAKELGCNFVRLAHYPHNEHMARVADERLMLWEEVPVYWTIQWQNPRRSPMRGAARAAHRRDRNRASVVVWSVANETPVSPPRTRFLRALVDTARAQDPTRLISAALEVRTDSRRQSSLVDDPFGADIDLLSFNEYIGWYDGLPDRAAVRWTSVTKSPW